MGQTHRSALFSVRSDPNACYVKGHNLELAGGKLHDDHHGVYSVYHSPSSICQDILIWTSNDPKPELLQSAQCRPSASI